MALAERIKEWAADYKQEGRQEGRQEGMHQGESMALQKLLVRRFGTLPPQSVQAIAAASLSDIEIWFDRAIDAPSLESVFGATPPGV